MKVEINRKDRRKKFIAVIGNRSAGKSTVIVSLTGCPYRGFRGPVTDTSSNENIYVIASSPQETGLLLEEFQEILTEIIQDENCRGLVMAIQPSRPSRRLSLENIIQEVQNRHIFEPYLFVLEPGRKDTPETQNVLIDVNNRLRDFGLVARGLDGRIFAYLNAREINQASQIF